jgi:hypothetical protein
MAQRKRPILKMPDPGAAQRQPQAITAEGGVDIESAGEAHDLGPWIETPSSTRVSRFRFDHLQRELQVQWTNGRNAGCVYHNVDYEGYRAFARVVSKGQHINSVLNGHGFDYMTGEENLPSNEKRKGIGSRLRT